ncbi:MAG: flagellar hook-associated protein FlgK, partial [Alphaproteobacteria bacterium]|nr:flagellar hook-associated protein FlgK [Alphaproteobacteria bacterium]
MTSLGAALNIGVTGLTANQFALATTANNIANVNTDGYVRKVTNFESKVLGTDQAGVAISGISRFIDAFLVREERVAAAQQNRFDAMKELHNQLQSLLGAPDDNLTFSGRLDRVFEDIADLAPDPNSTVRRVSAINEMQVYGNEVGRVSRVLQDLRGEADRRIGELISTINIALQRIDDLNPKIRRALALGEDSSGLQEQRERAVREIGDLIDLRTFDLPGGGLGLVTDSGIVLLDALVRQLDKVSTGTVGTNTEFSQINVSKINPDGSAEALTVLDPVVQSGTLRGLLDMRDIQLPAMAIELGEMSAKVIDQLNASHNDNSTVPAPASMVGRNVGILGTDSHNFTGSVTFGMVDAASTLTNRVTVDFTAGTVSLNGGAAVAIGGTTLDSVVTAVNTQFGGTALTLVNGVMTLQATGVSTGVAVLQDTTTPSARAGRGFAHFFGLNDLMQALEPSHFQTGLSGTDAHGFGATGDMSLQLRGPRGQVAREFTLDFATAGATTLDDVVSALNTGFSGFATFALSANGELQVTPAASRSDYRILTTNDTTSRGTTSVRLADLFGIGRVYRMDQAHQVTVRPDIVSNPSKLALAKLDLSATALAGTDPA